jgi:hypothetical protein
LVGAADHQRIDVIDRGGMGLDQHLADVLGKHFSIAVV